MKNLLPAVFLSTVGALPPCAQDDASCAVDPVKGSAMLQIRGASQKRMLSPSASPPMVWLEIDANLATQALRKRETKHLSKLLGDAVKFEKAEGGGRVKEFEKALEAVEVVGADAFGADEKLKKTAEAAMELVSEEIEADSAQETGELITMEDAMAIEGLTDTPENSNSSLCVEGDMCPDDDAASMLLQERVRAGFQSAVNLFDKSKPIKTCTYGDIDKATKKIWDASLQHIRNLVPCAATQFEETEDLRSCNICLITSQAGCSAGIGKGKAGATRVNLGLGCGFLGIAVHELGHALGMYHEQSRKDRDDFVKINWDNIKGDYKSQYAKDTGDETFDTDFPYDFGSLMHYSKTTFGSGGPTMSYKEGVTKKEMGNRMGFTKTDVQQLAKMYGCLDSVDVKCPAEDGECMKDECVCHADNSKHVVVKKKDENGCNRCVSDKSKDKSRKKEKDRRRRRRRKGASLLSSNSKVCQDLVDDSLCKQHAQSYCNYDGKVTITVRNEGLDLDFATEACAKTCNYC